MLQICKCVFLIEETCILKRRNFYLQSTRNQKSNTRSIFSFLEDNYHLWLWL